MRKTFNTAAAQTQVQPWVRLTLGPLPPHFTGTVRKAQGVSPHLRRIRIISAARCMAGTDAEAEAVTVLVPQELIDAWQTPAPGERSVEFLAASYMLSLAKAVLENQSDCIPF